MEEYLSLKNFFLVIISLMIIMYFLFIPFLLFWLKKVSKKNEYINYEKWRFILLIPLWFFIILILFTGIIKTYYK